MSDIDCRMKTWFLWFLCVWAIAFFFVSMEQPGFTEAGRSSKKENTASIDPAPVLPEPSKEEAMPAALHHKKSKGSIFVGIGIFGESSYFPHTWSLDESKSQFKDSSTYSYSYQPLTVQLGGAFYLVDGCGGASSSSCADVLAYGLLEYQHLFYSDPVRVFQIRAGVEMDLFFGKQRWVAWINRVGIGYAYYGVSDPSTPFVLTEIDERKIYVWPHQPYDEISNRLVVSIETGILVSIPKTNGLSAYLLVGIAPKISLKSVLETGHYLSTAVYAPTLGIRYRF